MKIQKKLIKESVGIQKVEPKTYSQKKQNIIITEKQLDYILTKLKKI